MTRREKLLHATAFATARRIEELLVIPRRQRARRFFELFQAVKHGLEEFSLGSGKCENRPEPGK
jgi:hypothetical protein